jgi:uncharacterized membrane protein
MHPHDDNATMTIRIIERNLHTMDDLGGFLFAMATLSLIVMVCIWVPYALISLLRKRRAPSAREIADERYARGELSEEEHRRVRTNLNSPEQGY